MLPDRAQMSVARIVLKRGIAGLIDYGVYFSFLVAYFAVFGEARADGRFELVGVGHLLVLVSVWMFLLPGLEAVLGYTLGKGLMDLKVVGLNHRKVTFGHAIMRHLLDPLDVFLALVVFAFVWRSRTPRRVGDLWAGTYVISDDAASEEKDGPGTEQQ